MRQLTTGPNRGIAGTMRKFNDGYPISAQSYNHQIRTTVKKIKRVVDSMTFYSVVEYDRVYGNSHLHFYLEHPFEAQQAVDAELFRFIGATEWRVKNEALQSPTMDVIYEAVDEDRLPKYGTLDINRNIYNEAGWKEYLLKNETKTNKLQYEWK